MSQISFEEVWQDVERLLHKGIRIYTLDQGSLNVIADVREDGVYIRSTKTGNIRKLPKRSFEVVWACLVSYGTYDGRHFSRPFHDSGVFAIMARLPYIEYSVDPLTLWLTPASTRPLGSVKRREKLA